MGAMALNGDSSMELKSRSFTSKEPHVAREPQVADPCPSHFTDTKLLLGNTSWQNYDRFFHEKKSFSAKLLFFL
jgi:hypothetical protein